MTASGPRAICSLSSKCKSTGYHYLVQKQTTRQTAIALQQSTTASNQYNNKILVSKLTSQHHSHHAAAGKTTCISNSSSSFRQRAAAFNIFSTGWSITTSPSKRPRIDKYKALMQSMHPKASRAK
ncbi:hypothetical protein Nepgr_032657 [Nepenthes gracilis]|uniref:Uncharacterized protein n=1 Tax=Nepenthes gracilis TaxID=150966 RepID=A0AAD3TKH5_NEPGR|nr:hypothetical protein Nepgr_032657 [Nepenthes gracilis]